MLNAPFVALEKPVHTKSHFGVSTQAPKNKPMFHHTTILRRNTYNPFTLVLSQMCAKVHVDSLLLICEQMRHLLGAAYASPNSPSGSCAHNCGRLVLFLKASFRVDSFWSCHTAAATLFSKSGEVSVTGRRLRASSSISSLPSWIATTHRRILS